MAQRTHTELIQDLRNDVTILRAELDAAVTELERAELLRVRERLRVAEEQVAQLVKKAEEADRQHQQVAVLEDRVNDLRRAREEAEKRHWQFVYIFAGAMASLLATVIVQLVMSWVRK